MTASTDRGRDVTTALTEVRTVLSRAETARKILDEPTEYHHRSDSPGRIDFDRPKHADPDVAEMRDALDEAIRLLTRWRRTGRKTTPDPR